MVPFSVHDRRRAGRPIGWWLPHRASERHRSGRYAGGQGAFCPAGAGGRALRSKMRIRTYESAPGRNAFGRGRIGCCLLPLAGTMRRERFCRFVLPIVRSSASGSGWLFVLPLVRSVGSVCVVLPLAGIISVASRRRSPERCAGTGRPYGDSACRKRFGCVATSPACAVRRGRIRSPRSRPSAAGRPRSGSCLRPLPPRPAAARLRRRPWRPPPSGSRPAPPGSRGISWRPA